MNLGKRGSMNKKANAILKQKFLGAGITRCERCGTDNFLSFAHKLKRRYMNTAEELSDINTCLLLCIPCHNLVEYDKEESEKLFSKLRGGVLE